ncbi:LPS translocon maturation chaperone LptM [Ensifer soli]|uniref:LPS translocon maturation chaperone LptM n=1 Tax=Ciceribacter sp. sgz301302 TaxID=3342379 RepID=UPI0035B74544
MRLRHKARLALALSLLPVLALSGCGRKGDLDRPSAAVTNQKQAPGTAEKAEPVADKPFFLDPLL